MTGWLAVGACAVAIGIVWAIVEAVLLRHVRARRRSRES